MDGTKTTNNKQQTQLHQQTKQYITPTLDQCRKLYTKYIHTVNETYSKTPTHKELITLFNEILPNNNKLWDPALINYFDFLNNYFDLLLSEMKLESDNLHE